LNITGIAVQDSRHPRPDLLELLNRRRLLQFGGVGGLGLTLGGLWQGQAAQAAAQAPAGAPRPIRACILVFFYGGPSHIDTFDMKPNAPAEVRGEFRPSATTVPGLRICEHLPRMARWMHKVALIRSVHHAARLHDAASIHALTGRRLDGPDRELFAPQPQFYPSYGGAVAYLRRGERHEVPFASLPFAFHNVVTVPCQGGGFLGAAYDPLLIDVDPARRSYHAELLRRADGLDRPRMHSRQNLLAGLERMAESDDSRRGLYERAYRLLENEAIARALDIAREPVAVRERYGFGSPSVARGEGGAGSNGAEMAYAREMRGQNLLLARRLVEAGIPFVNVYDCKQQGQNWDAHFKGANQHKTFLLPQADQGLSALIEDLDVRGLLDSTLVVAMGEFGRTPRINGDAGRDHWPDCYTVLLAGGGVQGGAIHGASDSIGAYPASHPVTPGDLAATIFWRFGLDPETGLRDMTGQPHRLAEGSPIRQLF
jgi:hypothetical protein